MTMMGERIDALARRITACRICRDAWTDRARLPHEPRPVCVLSSTARIAICGQAPGTRVHASGRPFTDPSGDRLRDWMGVDKAVFYDSSRIAIVPMGFCFPGHDAKGGDLPPRKECAAYWHKQVFAAMPQIKLRLIVGQYAQAWHLGDQRSKTLTETVSRWREFMAADTCPSLFPLPHPSWRNSSWIKNNPWFERALLPDLRKIVSQYLAD